MKDKTTRTLSPQALEEIRSRNKADHRLYEHAAIFHEGYVMAHQDRAALIAHLDAMTEPGAVYGGPERRQFQSAPGTYGSGQNRRVADSLAIFMQDQYYHHTKNFAELAAAVLARFSLAGAWRDINEAPKDGTRILLGSAPTEPMCPTCREPREPVSMIVDPLRKGPFFAGPCRCGFDWDKWTLEQYS